MGVPSDGSYGIAEGVLYGYPAGFKAGKRDGAKKLANQFAAWKAGRGG